MDAESRGEQRRRTVVVAPDSFKGSVGASDAAEAIAQGWTATRPGDVLVQRPMADGGEGTLAAFAAAVPGAAPVVVEVSGPDGVPHRASWLLLPPTPEAPRGTAVVELASTSGIELLRGRRLPLAAHTRGFGQAIRSALEHGVDRLVLAIGSSASTDGGVGVLRELGGVFENESGAPIGDGAAALDTLARVDLTRLRPPPPGGVRVLGDVTNPLTGAAGAAAVFGPQKGLVGAASRRVDRGLSRLADLIGLDPALPGAGAAGGTGYALLAWGAQLGPGAEEVARLIGLRDRVRGADAVITGEGSFDGQSAAGKAPSLVARIAREENVPCLLVAGRIDADVREFAASVSLTDLAGSGSAALADPRRWLRDAGEVLAHSAHSAVTARTER